MTMLLELALLMAGLAMSAFFSGSETGFYRATRVRLLIDALAGSPVARGLHWLTNHPHIFVGTTLVGNNIANYLTSLSIVLLVHEMHLSNPQIAEMIAPVLFAPVLFVYGELLPKNLFYQAPNKLLRWGGPLFLVCTVLFAPITAVLYVFSSVLQRLLGEAPEQVQLTLARAELHRMLQEGQEAGVLHATQRRLAQGLFEIANQPIMRYCTPIERVAPIRRGWRVADVLKIARRNQTAELPIMPEKGRKLIGYVRTIELYLQSNLTLEEIRPLIRITADTTYVDALLRMQSKSEPIAEIVTARGDTVGVAYLQDLVEPLLRGR